MESKRYQGIEVSRAEAMATRGLREHGLAAPDEGEALRVNGPQGSKLYWTRRLHDVWLYDTLTGDEVKGDRLATMTSSLPADSHNLRLMLAQVGVTKFRSVEVSAC